MTTSRSTTKDPAGAGLEVVAAVAGMLALDALAMRVIAKLETAGVDTLLMKGPVTSRWLFDDPVGHVYTDVDLLIAPTSRAAAAAVLAGLGFRDFHRSVLGIYRPVHERAWLSDDGIVDLHVGIWGVSETRRADVWCALWEQREAFDLHGRTVMTLGSTARRVQLALHAAPSRTGTRPVEDLRRGLETGDDQQWREAAALAESWGAAAEFGVGLRRLDAGRSLLKRLDLPLTLTTHAVLQEHDARPEALAFARVADAPPGTRAAMVRGWLSVEDPAASMGDLAVSRLKAVGRVPVGAAQWVRARHVVRSLAAGGVAARRTDGNDSSTVER